MATSPRDVTMTLSVETLGNDNIQKLQDSVAALAKEGGDAAPEFQALADEIGRLGQQAGALQAFEQLATQTASIAQKQEQASASAQELGARLAALSAVTTAAKESQQAVAAQLADATAKGRGYRDELALLEVNTDKAGKKSNEYRQEVDRLKLAKIAQRAEVERLRAALAEENAAVSVAQEEQNSLAAVYKATAASSNAATTALKAHESQLLEASTAAAALDVSTGNVAASQAALVQAFNSAGNEAKVLQGQTKLLAAELEQSAIAAKAQEDALLAVAAGQAAAESKALADQTKLLAAEFEFAAESARQLEKSQRDAAVAAAALKAAQSEEAARQLAVAQGLLTTELELAAAAADRAGQEHRDLVAAQQAAEAQTNDLALAAQAAAAKIDTAFATVGARSAQDLRAEIDRVRAAMDTVRATAGTTGASVAGAFAAGEAKIKALERDIREVNGTLTMGDKAAKLFSNSMGQITAGNLVADGVGYLVNKVKELGAAFLDAIVGGDQLKRGLNAIYKNAEITASQIDFLRRSSSESGVAFGALGQEFVKFSAAMNSANIPLEQSNNLFRAVTAASASLGLSSDATAGSLNALGQMASKGVVSMEELRQQLGDRLPGALGLVAKGLGITEGQLVTLVSSGQLATRDFIVPFTNALAEMRGEVDGLVPTWERFKGMLSEYAQGIGDAGVTATLTMAIKLLGGVVGGVAMTFSALTEAVMLNAKGLAAAASYLSGNTDAWNMFSEEVEKSRLRLTGQAMAFQAMLDPAKAATNAVAGHAAALTSSTAEAVKAINASENLGAAQKLAALSTALAADATLDASAKIVQYNVAAAALLDTQAAQTDAFAKSAKAVKDQGDTLVSLAQLTGDAVAAQNASITAAEMHAAALEKVAQSQAAETAMLIAQKAELIANAADRGTSTDKIKEQVEALDQKIATSSAETEQANAALASLQAELAIRQLSADTYRDNSAAVEDYTAALALAEDAYTRVKISAELGLATEVEVESARLRVLRATVMLNDAERDRTLTQQALTAAIRVNSDLEQAGLTLQMAQLKAAESKAIADGNDYAARQARIAQKELEIKIIRLKVEAQIAEQNAVIAGIELSKAELDIGDPLYKQKVAALDLSIKSAEAKMLEAKATGENVAALERELAQLKAGVDATGKSIVTAMNTGPVQAMTAAIRQTSDAVELLNTKYMQTSQYTERQIDLLLQQVAAQEKVLDLKAREKALEDKRRNVDSEGFTLNTAGERITLSLTPLNEAVKQGVEKGLSAAEATRIAQANYTPGGRTSLLSGGTEIAGSVDMNGFWGEVHKALDRQVLSGAGVGSSPATSPATASPGTSAAATGTTPAKTYNVTINGRTIKTASDADAQALIGALKDAKLTA